MDQIKAAIIGCGAIYRNHADALKSSGIAHLAAVVDINEERAKVAASQYGCSYYTDYREMLKDSSIQVVHICTPHYLHASMSIEAMKAGKHVFTEKPMALDEAQAEEMIEKSKLYGKHLGVCFQNRCNNTSIKAKEMLSKGSLGKVLGAKGFVTWHRDEPYYTESGWRGSFKTEGGGVLINQAIHTIDLMQWLVGGVNEIKANVDTRLLDKVIEVEDTADATMYFNNGAVGLFYATNCYTTNSPVEVEIHCEKGRLSLVENDLYLIEGSTRTLLVTDKSEDPTYKSYWGVSHKTLIDKFYKSVATPGLCEYVTAEDGIETMKIINGIYKSSALGKKIRL